MADPHKMSAFEEQLYEATVEEAVEEVAQLRKGDVDSINDAIQHFIDEVDFNDTRKEKFRNEVLRKVAEQREQAEDEREQQILEKLEGKVIGIKKGNKTEKKLVGTHEKETFYARGGSLFRRIFGKFYNAQEVADKMIEVQELEDRIQKNQEQIDMITAARDASKNSLRVARQLFKSKREGRLLIGYIDDWRASWKAARVQKKTTHERFKQEYEGLTQMQEKDKKRLMREKEAMDVIMDKVDARREKTREIFEKNFGAQVDHLLQLKGNRRDVEEELRDQIQQFGKNANIVYLEYYLNEALGIKPGVLFDEKGKKASEVYREPESERERLKELVDVEKWCQFIAGNVSSGQVQNVLSYVRDKNPELIQEIRNADVSGSPSPSLLEMRFLFSGKDTNGKELLPSNRRARLNPETVLRLYRYARERNNKAELQEVMEKFVAEGDEYKGRDFDYLYDFLKRKTANQSTTVAANPTPNPPPPQPLNSTTTSQPQNFGPTPGLQDASANTAPSNPDTLSPKLERFAEMFNISDRPDLVKDIYEHGERLIPDWESMLQNRKNHAIFRLLVEGKSRDMTLQKENLSLEDRFQFVSKVLDNLPAIHSISIENLKQHYNDFRSQGSEHTCRKFFDYLVDIYKSTS